MEPSLLTKRDHEFVRRAGAAAEWLEQHAREAATVLVLTQLECVGAAPLNRSANSSDWCRGGERPDIAGPMSDAEIVITFQSERDLWYVQRGDATAMVSAEDMVHEYYRWRYAGAPGVWRDRARAFCRQRLVDSSSRPAPRK